MLKVWKGMIAINRSWIGRKQFGLNRVIIGGRVLNGRRRRDCLGYEGIGVWEVLWCVPSQTHIDLHTIRQACPSASFISSTPFINANLNDEEASPRLRFLLVYLDYPLTNQFKRLPTA